ncbi:MAG: hypothetical protein IJW18_02190 [Lachnospiraceae bacterium]|nr:hypothetical protein [Lachnospiraceae bacterium]
MAEILDKITVFFITAILLFVAPVFLIANRLDQTSQSYIDKAVTKFVDGVRVTGIISVDEYEALSETLDLIQPCCNIKIIVSRKEVIPKEEGEVFAYYKDTYTNELLEYMYSDNRNNIYLSAGDYIQMSVTTTKPTIAQRIIGSDFFTPLHISYGGYVGNNPY